MSTKNVYLVGPPVSIYHAFTFVVSSRPPAFMVSSSLNWNFSTKCVKSRLVSKADHSWPILVAHAIMSICISNIYDSISQKSSKCWDEGDHSCTIVVYTPKKGAKIHCNCIKNLAELHATSNCIPVANMVVTYDRISSSVCSPKWFHWITLIVCFFHVYEHVNLPIEPINMYAWVNGVDANSITTPRILHYNITQNKLSY